MKIKSLGLLFKSLVKKYPSRYCLDFGNQNKFTFEEMDILSDKMAIYLTQRGLKEDDCICIQSKKDLFSFVIILSCLKLGIIYSFFDLNGGQDRINNIINITKPKKIFLFNYINTFKKVVLINEEFKNKICLINIKDKINYKNKYFNAYVMFTSGSTGKPKGVIISHFNLLFFIKWLKSYFKINKKTVMSNLNPLHFDNSVFDLYGAFFSGAKLVPVEKKEILIPKILMNKLRATKCNLWFSVPSLLDLILHLKGKNEFKKTNLSKMIFGGERFPLQSVKKIYSINKKIQFYNVSGPTECTCMCSGYKLKTEDIIKNTGDVFIGKINPYFDYKIINNEQKKIGELYLEGPAVSSGYYNDLSRTKEKFYKIGKIRGYKTGDLVIEEKNKLLKIIGRVDNQIKYLGHRIELEEIEKCFIKKFKIKNCIASLKPKSSYPFKKIVITLDKKIGKINYIKKKLGSSLPSYMLPEEIIYVKKFCYNSNDKLDRKKY